MRWNWEEDLSGRLLCMDQSYFRFLFRLARKSKQSGLSKSEKSLAKRNVTLGFAPKNAKSVFGFGNPDLDFPKKTHPKCRYFYLSVHVVVELSSNIKRGNWGFRRWPKTALLLQITSNQNLVGMDQAVDTLRNTVSIPEVHVWSMAWAWF